ncbi:MAG: ribonuclease Y [Patescibacteria group bacterium]|nr:ribonuclease Y [Patescibacteria group bacterium]
MNQFILLLIGIFALGAGALLGYFARQSIARKRADTIETLLQTKVSRVKKDVESIKAKAETEASQIIDKAKKDTEAQRKELFEANRVLLQRENILGKRTSTLDDKEKEFIEKVSKLKEIKLSLEDLRQESLNKLEKIAKLGKEDAKKELLDNIEKEYEVEILEKMRKLKVDGFERYERKAKEILAFAMQKCALSQAQEITTTSVSLPSDEIKGRIIGKEGRNIKALEKLTGVEVMVDETPETVLISGFDPVRRQIAKNALEKLIQDGRIQPARIEEMVQKAESEIVSEIKEAGEKVVYETGILGLDPKIVQLLGRLHFRTSYGQNVLLHSIEVSYLSEAIAAELGADTQVAKKAGLLHDIGKALDHQTEGSHVKIGMRILEKFGVEKSVIDAMKSHHEEYPYETIEAIIVQVADQISGARPGARKDTLENYIKRLEELENIAMSFSGVKKTYAIQAGREIRVFVKPKEVNDFATEKMAKGIANKIQRELRYPGEIKVTVVRENRIIEYAR